MVLFIDNYDSFTYNLVDLIGQNRGDLQVARNDKISLDEIEALAPEGIVLSPGPGTPDESGICPDVIRRLGSKIPILGVCLGHQCIGQVYGARVIRAPQPVHGKPSRIIHDGEGIFSGLLQAFSAARYHSLIIAGLPESLVVTAHSEDGLIMGVRHKTFPVNGVQFHPESILTAEGKLIIDNWLQLVKSYGEQRHV
jgi:anthranilate synthase/aminodeoxychorismate synthase-like glutamine amidotransferase